MNYELICGDVLDVLRTLPADSVHCCVTSPPYWGLRSYLPKGHEDKHREIGSENTPEAFVETMVNVFREVRRVLHPSGTVWLNLADTMRDKDLCLIPWRVAMALQEDGWWVRSVICWHKKSCMPESVNDRPTNSWEPIFLLAKSAKYFYDAEAVKEKAEESSIGRQRRGTSDGHKFVNGAPGQTTHSIAEPRHRDPEREISTTRNQRNVWSLGPEPYAEAHFATFPTEIPRRAILAGTSAKGCCPECLSPWVRVVENVGQTNYGGLRKRADAPGAEVSKTSVFRTGNITQSHAIGWQPGCKCGLDPTPCTVLDPFNGSGTSGYVAVTHGRNYIGIDLNPEYIELAHKRIGKAGYQAELFDLAAECAVEWMPEQSPLFEVTA
jgi:DNA modification methylase